MTIEQLIFGALMAAGFTSISLVNADPRPAKPFARPLKAKLPVLHFKPNLVATNLGWNGEFCNRSKCFREFKKLGFNKATCKFSAWIKNLGRGNAGRFRVTLKYLDWKGTPRQTTVVLFSGLKRKGLRGSAKLIYFNVPYYRINRYLTMKVDSANQVSETKENDNTSHYKATY